MEYTVFCYNNRILDNIKRGEKMSLVHSLGGLISWMIGPIALGDTAGRSTHELIAAVVACIRAEQDQAGEHSGMDDGQLTSSMPS